MLRAGSGYANLRLAHVQVLREVVDAVLKDHSVEEQVLVNRAKVRPPSASLPSFQFQLRGSQWDPRTHPTLTFASVWIVTDVNMIITGSAFDGSCL